ncbi:MAG: hypothetical protein ABSE20_03565 [Acetobacteraceae bacterium]|jgi:hypothetical protein
MWKDPGPHVPPASGRGDADGCGLEPSSAEPAMLIRTLTGHVTSWSAGMEQRYGFLAEYALGRASHELLGTAFPRALPDIVAVLVSEHTWSGGLLHRHADGNMVISVNHWFLNCDDAAQDWRVTEVHSDLVPGSDDARDQIADLLEVLKQELSEPLTALRNYVDGAQRILRPAWPDLENLRKAVTQMSAQIDRGVAGVHLLRELAAAMRATE